MNLTAQLMLNAFECLDRHLTQPLRLVMGGGGAMVLAYQFTLSTTDIDAVPASGTSITELEPLVRKVAEELSLPVDWLNPYYSSFTHILPSDYGTRLVRVVSLRHLTVDALSKEDLLLMKCFAARQKDVVHGRALVKKGADTQKVRSHIHVLRKKRIEGCDRAEKFLSDIELFFRDQNEESE